MPKLRIVKLTPYFIALLVIGGWTAFIKLIFPQIELVNLVMTYLLLNALIAVQYGRGPSLVSAALSVAAFDFFFVLPHLTFAVAETKYFLTFFIMFVVTLLISHLTIQIKKNAETANRAKREVERETIISSLLSSVSHDLRTPLTSISGAASTLLSQEFKLSENDHKHLLETIHDESLRLNRLVENILQMTKIESGNIPVQKELHSLEEIIGSALNRLNLLLQDRPVTTEIPNQLSLVPLDPILIGQVLVNLLENAVRYTPQGSPLGIFVFQDPQKIWVEILDRGPGIPQQEKNLIFEKFYRSDKRDIFGSGLGLAICKGIIKAHGGQMGVKDREGGGSIFYFWLPL